MKIATIRGIDVYVHWTFWALIAIYLIPVLLQSGVAAALSAAIFILGVFACVVAHEFGHALAAAHYGIPTADITLLPIGGVARLKSMPEKPVQELVVALAGPAVNVVLGGILFLLIMLGVAAGGAAPGLGEGMQMDILAQLLAANIFLFAFNLLPAFPMDGGRVLRALLAMRTTHLRATEIAARVGRWMALLFVVTALLTGHWTLLLIAGFIFLAGTAELMNVRLRNMVGAAGPSGAASHDWTGATGTGSVRGQWYTQVWPTEGDFDARYGDGLDPNRRYGDDVIDAIDVKEVKDPN